MDVRHLLLTFVVLTHGLTTVMWWAAGTWLGLSRKAALHWLVASLANGLALTCMVLNDGQPGTTLVLITGVLVTFGVISLRRGLQAFLKLSHTDSSHFLLASGTALFSLAVCIPFGWRASGIIGSSSVIAWVLLRTAIECFEPLKTEFQAGIAWTHSGLLLTAMTLFTGLALTELGSATPWHWVQGDFEQTQFVLVIVSLILSILSAFVLGYIVVTRLVRRLEHLSHHDALTGLLNRRAFELLLDREAQRLQRFGQPFTVLMVDIDHFKRINDRLGHAGGDAVLRAVSQTLQAHARGVDRVARVGGEEFSVLLPQTLHEGAGLAAERLRQAISQINIPWADESITVTISTGVATANDSLEALPSLLRRADDALYQAKAEGRNKVVSAPDQQAACA
ncbi:MAG: GGDEF domain-containing protein [Burkholderiales bacterium]|nr:GGDEF domain-containing protein [Burkholderiales bacterium]